MNAPSAASIDRSVLIVDDDEDFLAAMKHAISQDRGYRVTLLDSGEAALGALRREHFDVMILDYKMPGLSGLSVLQRMREETLDTPVVMLTSAGSESVAVKAMKMGAYDYVRKDEIETDHLCILIDGVVERHLFKREKALRKALEREHEKSLVIIETYHSTLASIAQIVSNSLAVVSASIREHEERLKPFVVQGGSRRFSRVFKDLKQEHGVIALTVRALLDMANVLHGNSTQLDYTEKMQELMNGNLKGLQDFETSDSSVQKLSGK